ncbi:LamG-like jellyroll fold domain-containing protein [Sphingobacterium kitahiroshimense]|uniref:LamG-like jellyroll fold domain-containing protein n=1 Tax=Sphingobacterium kitahiroshimense TaxID=470446 RepID=A0ABV0BRY8_9SPHI
MNKYIHIFKNITYGIGGMLLLVSCNKDFPNLLQNFNEAKDSPENRDKVLMVIVDGLAGPAVQAIEPTNLIEMTRNGMVSYGSLADPTTDFQMTNASVASSLLTGVYANKNKVVSNDLSTLDAATYPTMFSRLKSTNKASSMYTSSADYTTFLGKDAHVETVVNDEAVVAAAVKGLEADSADLNVVHLTDVEQAGASSEYSDESTVYVDAVNKLDKQVLQLVNTIKTRKSYSNENWLVVVTSGKGGDSKAPVTDFTAFGDSKRNTYTLMFSPKFSRKVLPRPSAKDIPFVGAATRYTYLGNNKVTSSLADVTKFNMGAGSDWTVTLFLKYNVVGANYYYPSFLSKRAAGFTGAGWNIFLEAGYWGINSSIAGQAFGPNINDGEWHALTTVIKRSGSQDSVYVYTDGTSASVSGKVSQVSANANNLDNNAPLTLGNLAASGDNLDISICNVQIYDRAFSFGEVKQYGGVTNIDDKSPFWNNLQGYWPGYDDVNTNKLTEKTGKGAGNFELKGAISWVSFNELVPFFQPPISDAFFRQVPNAVDVPFMIYQWLGVSVESAWKLDGKSWSPNYAQIRN